MNKIFICLFLFISSSILSQNAKGLTEFNINIGTILSSFYYQDVNGDANEDIRYRNGKTYSLNFGFKLGQKHKLCPELIYQEFGANSTYDSSPMEWTLNYLGMGIGYSYLAFNTESFSISPSLYMHVNYMSRGTQMIGENQYDLREQDLFKPFDLTTSLNLNTRFKVMDKLQINLDYRYVFGLSNIENTNGDEKTKNKGHLATIGLTFNL
jgi:opacity protein-like surface antigen